jgi:arylsulfatase
MGGITEIATSALGNSSVRPKDKAPIAETLMLNGYSTAQFGKCHEVPVWEVSPVGPFNQWPTGSGFEYFYGFVGAEANQYYPGLYEGTSPVEPPKSPEEGYTLTEDLADRAITWVAPSCTGPTASPTKARSAASSTTSSTSPRPSWKRLDCPSPPW